MVSFNEYILPRVTQVGSDLIGTFARFHIQMHSSNSLVYKLYSLSSSYSVKHQVQCHPCVGALQTLIGWWSGKWCWQRTPWNWWIIWWTRPGTAIMYCCFTQQVMFHNSEKHRIFCLSVPGHYFQSEPKSVLCRVKLFNHIDPVGRLLIWDIAVSFGSGYYQNLVPSYIGNRINKKMKQEVWIS